MYVLSSISKIFCIKNYSFKSQFNSYKQNLIKDICTDFFPLCVLKSINALQSFTFVLNPSATSFPTGSEILEMALQINGNLSQLVLHNVVNGFSHVVGFSCSIL